MLRAFKQLFDWFGALAARLREPERPHSSSLGTGALDPDCF